MKNTLILTSLMATTGIVNAITLMTSNFDGNDATTDPTKATGLSWTTDAAVTMNNSGDLAAYGSNFAVFGSNSDVNNILSSTNLNTSRPTERGYSFEFTLSSANTAYDWPLVMLLGISIGFLSALFNLFSKIYTSILKSLSVIELGCCSSPNLMAFLVSAILPFSR